MLPRPNKDSRSNNRVVSSQMQQCSPHNTPGDAKQQKEGRPCAQTGSGVNAELKGIDLTLGEFLPLMELRFPLLYHGDYNICSQSRYMG